MEFLDNKYTKWYFHLVQEAMDRNLSKSSDVYLEEHHIIPKSLGGSDNKDNLVLLTAREHYVAHRLLVKMTTKKDHQKMHMALWCMVTANDCAKVVAVKSKVYEKIREDYSFKVRGRDHFNYGLVRSEETKAKIREKRKYQVLPQSHYDNMSKVMKNKIWINDGTVNKRIDKEKLEEFKLLGFMEGRLLSYINDSYKSKLREKTSKRWEKVKQTGHTGLLIRV